MAKWKQCKTQDHSFLDKWRRKISYGCSKRESNNIVLVLFIVIYAFSVWGTSLLHWWDKCAFRMDKPKIREFKINRPKNRWCFVCLFLPLVLWMRKTCWRSSRLQISSLGVPISFLPFSFLSLLQIKYIMPYVNTLLRLVKTLIYKRQYLFR